MKGQATSASWLLRMVPCRHSLGEGWSGGEGHLNPTHRDSTFAG